MGFLVFLWGVLLRRYFAFLIFHLFFIYFAPIFHLFFICFPFPSRYLMCAEVARFSDETGKIPSHFESLSSALPPQDHQWVGDWKLDIDVGSKRTDSEGWSYAVNFDGLVKGKRFRLFYIPDNSLFYFFMNYLCIIIVIDAKFYSTLFVIIISQYLLYIIIPLFLFLSQGTAEARK